MGKRTASHIITYNINESNIIIEKLNVVSIDLNGAWHKRDDFQLIRVQNEFKSKAKEKILFIHFAIEHWTSNNVQHKWGDYPRYRSMREWIVRKTHKTNDKSASQANAHKQQPNSKYFAFEYI